MLNKKKVLPIAFAIEFIFFDRALRCRIYGVSIEDK